MVFQKLPKNTKGVILSTDATKLPTTSIYKK